MRVVILGYPGLIGKCILEYLQKKKSLQLILENRKSLEKDIKLKQEKLNSEIEKEIVNAEEQIKNFSN